MNTAIFEMGISLNCKSWYFNQGWWRWLLWFPSNDSSPRRVSPRNRVEFHESLTVGWSVGFFRDRPLTETGFLFQKVFRSWDQPVYPLSAQQRYFIIHSGYNYSARVRRMGEGPRGDSHAQLPGRPWVPLCNRSVTPQHLPPCANKNKTYVFVS